MLFIVIERFKSDDTRAFSEWYRRSGRMLPGGVTCDASWVDLTGAHCFQLMDAPNRELLHLWASRWDDLIEFEIVPVQAADDFWSMVL